MSRKLRLVLQLSFLQLTSTLIPSPSFATSLPTGATGILTSPAISAERKVTGRIIDEYGQGLPGVNVAVKGTTRGTSTDVNGNYSLESVNDHEVLVFSFVGYVAQEIRVGSATQLNVTLKADTKALEEIVVVGYGTQKKTTVTGAISTIKGDAIAQVPAPNISQSLAGRVAGVSMRPNGGQPGKDDPDIYIRGVVTTGNSGKTAS